MGTNEWILLGIIVYIPPAALLARRVALDMANHGMSGWPYGLLTFMVPPFGLTLWLLDRDRPPLPPEHRPSLATAGEGFVVALLILTFPWGLIAWAFVNRRVAPSE